MREFKLRNWFKDLLGDDCQWNEPGFGGSVGAGDALVQLPRNGKLSVELKAWEIKTKGICCDMRPAQIRYHYMSWHKDKGKTAIVFALCGEVYVVAGQYVPRDKYNHVVAEKMIHIHKMDTGATKSEFFRAVVRAFNK